MRHNRFPVLIGLSALLLSVTASGGRIHYNNHDDLEWLVSQAEVIVVARAAKPFRRTASIDITPEGQKPDASKYPPYKWTVYRYKVEAVLNPGSQAATLVGQVIEVEGANVEQGRYLHRRYYLEGVSKSPIYHRYRPKNPVDPTKGESVILFLNRPTKKGSPYRLAVEQAIEQASMLKQIEELCSKGKCESK